MTRMSCGRLGGGLPGGREQSQREGTRQEQCSEGLVLLRAEHVCSIRALWLTAFAFTYTQTDYHGRHQPSAVLHCVASCLSRLLPAGAPCAEPVCDSCPGQEPGRDTVQAAAQVQVSGIAVFSFWAVVGRRLLVTEASFNHVGMRRGDWEVVTVLSLCVLNNKSWTGQGPRGIEPGAWVPAISELGAQAVVPGCCHTC